MMSHPTGCERADHLGDDRLGVLERVLQKEAAMDEVVRPTGDVVGDDVTPFDCEIGVIECREEPGVRIGRDHTAACANLLCQPPGDGATARSDFEHLRTGQRDLASSVTEGDQAVVDLGRAIVPFSGLATGQAV